MTTLYLNVVANRVQVSLMTLEVDEIGSTEKAIQYAFAGGRFWMPKVAVFIQKTGEFNGCLMMKKWFKFNDSTFNKIKNFIDHVEYVNGYCQTN